MSTVRHPIVMFVVAVLAVIGIGVGIVAATTPPIVNEGVGTMSLTSQQATALSNVALRMATTNGDRSPTSTEVVASTRERALTVVTPGDFVNGATGACWVIQMRGHFTVARGPSGAAPPKGMALTVIVNAATYEVEDWSVGNVVSNIASLGTALFLGL
jgi:hypothetical protein